VVFVDGFVRVGRRRRAWCTGVSCRGCLTRRAVGRTFGRGGVLRVVCVGIIRASTCAAGAVTTAGAPVDELEGVYDDLEFRSVVAFLVLPLVEPEPSFDEDRSAFFEVLVHRLGGFAVGFKVDEGGFF